MTVSRIASSLPAGDPAALAVWCRDLLGFDTVMDHGLIVTLAPGAAHQKARLSLASDGGPGTAVSIEVDDLDDVIARAGDAIACGWSLPLIIERVEAYGHIVWMGTHQRGGGG